jgi:hypothetical protein
MSRPIDNLHTIYLINTQGEKFDRLEMERENSKRVQTWFHGWNSRRAYVIYNELGRRGDRARGK